KSSAFLAMTLLVAFGALPTMPRTPISQRVISFLTNISVKWAALERYVKDETYQTGKDASDAITCGDDLFRWRTSRVNRCLSGRGSGFPSRCTVFDLYYSRRRSGHAREGKRRQFAREWCS